MSDLEKQASTWVPPWQRPAAQPTSDTPPNDLREAAEQAAARWSSPSEADTSGEPEAAEDTTPDGATSADAARAGQAGGDSAEKSGAAADGRSSRVPGSRGGEQRGSRDSTEIAAPAES